MRTFRAWSSIQGGIPALAIGIARYHNVSFFIAARIRLAATVRLLE